MFKAIVTLVRGRTHQAVESVIDANALEILDQQIRDSARIVDRARKALALAIGQDRREEQHIARLGEKISDLETRAIAALEGGREDLAEEAADAIADMENEREAAIKAHEHFAAEALRLRKMVKTSEQRLRDLENGRRLARTNEAVYRLRDQVSVADSAHLNTLSDAEATLSRLLGRQEEQDMTLNVMEELASEQAPSSITDKLAVAGFGQPTASRAEDVMKRLRKKSAQKSGDVTTTSARTEDSSSPDASKDQE